MLDALARSISASSSVLEIGCGTCNVLRALRERVGCSCAGVDPSSAMLALAPRNVGDLHCCSAERMEFPPTTFDFVYSVDVIHHIRDRGAAFGEIARVLREDGRVCTVTDSESVIRRRLLSHYFPETIDVELARYPRIETLRDEMARAGFVDLREDEVAFEHDIHDARAVRDKVFSSLKLIDETAFHVGLARLEDDLKRGPLRNVARYTLLWASA
ncbi:MAG TPA: class I SAM-dependent methyltransferase [Polyangiaceae bacterium]|nr:class I SAM-dependent methyltransferase [Polyangiaceae bacterium]